MQGTPQICSDAPLLSPNSSSSYFSLHPPSLQFSLMGTSPGEHMPVFTLFPERPFVLFSTIHSRKTGEHTLCPESRDVYVRHSPGLSLFLRMLLFCKVTDFCLLQKCQITEQLCWAPAVNSRSFLHYVTW